VANVKNIIPLSLAKLITLRSKWIEWLSIIIDEVHACCNPYKWQNVWGFQEMYLH
jgi:hypothetical protein